MQNRSVRRSFRDERPEIVIEILLVVEWLTAAGRINIYEQCAADDAVFPAGRQAFVTTGRQSLTFLGGACGRGMRRVVWNLRGAPLAAGTQV